MIAQILLFLFFLCEHWNSGIFTDLCKSGQSILGRVQIPCHDLSFQILHSCHPQSPTKAEYLLLLINRFVLATFPSISSEPNITFLKPRLISFLLSTTKNSTTYLWRGSRIPSKSPFICHAINHLNCSPFPFAASEQIVYLFLLKADLSTCIFSIIFPPHLWENLTLLLFYFVPVCTGFSSI